MYKNKFFASVFVTLILLIEGTILYRHFQPSLDGKVSVDFNVMDVTYPDGTIIAGLPWGPTLTDTRLYIHNSSDRAYSNIDFLVRTDLVIVAIAAEPGPTNCYFSAPQSSTAPRTIFGKDATGKDVPIPLEPITGIQAISSIYRGLCDRLPPRSEIEVILGVSTFKLGEPNPFR
jgi:hypothetical protein